MNKKESSHPAGRLKHLNVLGRRYVYDTWTMAYAEVNAKSGAEAAPPDIACVKEDARNSLGPASSPELKSIILQVSHACNLRCRYCSADFGRYGNGAFRMMSPETAVKGIDFLFENSGPTGLAVNYFGGEPLLNLATVMESARYARKRAEAEGREVALHLVTNGVLLTAETILRLDDLGFSLTVSLDGPGEHHDRMRPSADGASSFGATAQALRMMTALPVSRRVTVRGTFTRDSVYFFPAVRFIVESGFSKNCSYEPVFLPSRNPLALRWRDLPRIRTAYEELAVFYAAEWNKGRPFCLWDFDDAVTQLALGRPKRARCGAGASTVALTAEGDFFACHMSTGMEDALVGNLAEGFSERFRTPWLERYANGRAGCADCWLVRLCGGGCNTHALFYNKNLSHPYRLECAIMEMRYRLAFWLLSEVRGLREAIRSARHTLSDPSGGGHYTVPLWSCDLL